MFKDEAVNFHFYSLLSYISGLLFVTAYFFVQQSIPTIIQLAITTILLAGMSIIMGRYLRLTHIYNFTNKPLLDFFSGYISYLNILLTLVPLGLTVFSICSLIVLYVLSGGNFISGLFITFSLYSVMKYTIIVYFITVCLLPIIMGYLSLKKKTS